MDAPTELAGREASFEVVALRNGRLERLTKAF